MKVTIDDIIKIRQKQDDIKELHDEFINQFTQAKECYEVVVSQSFFEWIRTALQKEDVIGYSSAGEVIHSRENIVLSDHDIFNYQHLFFFNSYVQAQANKQNIKNNLDDPLDISNYNIKLLSAFFNISLWVEEDSDVTNVTIKPIKRKRNDFPYVNLIPQSFE